VIGKVAEMEGELKMEEGEVYSGMGRSLKLNFSI